MSQTAGLVTHQKRRDWFRIIRCDLVYAGVSMAKVADACGRDLGTVKHWTEEGEPKDTDARTVLALYRKHCPEKYHAHMLQYDPDYQERLAEVIEPATKQKAAPKAKRMKLWHSPPELQYDLFGGVA